MITIRSLLSLIVVVGGLSGCGTYVPEIQENPLASEPERSDFIQAIARNIRCEVQNSVIHLYEQNNEIDPLNRNLSWFDSWAVQINLTLTTDEKGSLSPSANLLPPSPATAIFNVGLGVTQSEEAQRIDKIGAFFTVAQLKNLQACPPRPPGLFIFQNDLKTYEWLKAATIAIDNGNFPAPLNANGPAKTNVLSHEVKFDIISGGSVTPGWKLTTATINQAGTLLSGTRDRTQDLTITFGPVDPQWSVVATDPITHKAKIDPKTHKPVLLATALAPAASNAVLAAEIGNAITNGVRSALHP